MIKKRMVGNALPEGEWRKTAEAAPLPTAARRLLFKLHVPGVLRCRQGGLHRHSIRHFLQLPAEEQLPRKK